MALERERGELAMADDNERRRKSARRGVAVAAAVLCCLATPRLGAAQVIPKTAAGDPKAAASGNPYNDELLRMTPEARAAKLAGFLGGTCIGTNPFLMGVTKEGRAKGYAYWSLQCAGDKAYMIQLTPEGQGAAIDCQALKEGGEGRECYKAF
jgi:hypothetical protein